MRAHFARPLGREQEKRLMERRLTNGSRASEAVLSVNIASLLRPGGGALLTDIHFHARKGECLAVIGPNGSGKTSLLRAIDQQLTRARFA